MIPWLQTRTPQFPAPDRALREPNGLLAAGGELTPDWLLAAYSLGIFPWFSEGEPILWWSPDPRMVVFPAELRLTRSLLKTLKSGRFEVRCDTAFAQVMRECAAPRDGAAGTWISPQIQAAYCYMHELGWAHSVESWRDNVLVGGLYGLAIGRVFYGESMFHRETDASKVAFAHLTRHLEAQNYAVIDCQMTTAHLASLGGREISRANFVSGLSEWARENVAAARWPADCLLRNWADQRSN
jgi:leucyl/phenylalanyl-tRNA--protein transferase